MKIFILASLSILSTSLFSQLKVDQYGRIGMGTNYPNSGYKCHIKGDLLLSNYPILPTYEFQFKVGNGDPGTDIGSTADKIAFWSTWTSYNKLYSERYYRVSDASFKSNLAPINSPLKKVLNLKAYIYDFRDNYISPTGDSLTRTTKEYGFISQEVETTLNEVKITDNVKDAKLMDYDQIIPLLVGGMQEQQKQISALQGQIAKLIATSGNGNPFGGGNGNGNPLNPVNVSKLFPASPNPISSNTNLSYYLSPNNTSAEIKIWDMQGVERKNYILNTQQGNNHVTLDATELTVGGSYVYALFTNGAIVDAKTMIYNK